MRRAVFDTETNGLLDELTTVHSLVLRDLDTDEVVSCTDNDPERPSIEQGLAILSKAERAYGHNAIGFDIPAILKVYPNWKPPKKVFDTLLVAQMRWAHIAETDYALNRKGKLPGQFIGAHSLEAWGYRMGILKGKYLKDHGWETWTPEMQEYCERDTLVLRELILRIRKAGVSTEAVETEHELGQYLFHQESNGFPFDLEAAIKFQGELAVERENLGAQLREVFGSFYVKGKEFVPKKDNKKMGYVKGAPCTKIILTEFSATSGAHIANRLTKLYGWKPVEFTGSGKPKVDEGMLKGLTHIPVVKTVQDYLVVNKRLSQLAEGKQAWMKVYQERHGFPAVHGRIQQCGAITHRATHREPNMSAVPKNTKPFGQQCRALFTAPPLPGWSLMGADASGLELRCLGHYMARYDGGAYIKIILEGDPHSANRDALELPADKANRDKAKTWIYAYLYGAGDAKLGAILDPSLAEEEAKHLGKTKRAAFERNTAALKMLIKNVKEKGKAQGWVRALDGRRVYIRHEHASLNTLLQCAGAIICKRWIVEYSRRMTETCGVQGWNGKWAACAWSHDEIQNAVRDSIAEIATSTAVASIRAMTDHFKFRCPLDGEAHVGRNWKDTH
jgi:DNA polymerase family A